MISVNSPAVSLHCWIDRRNRWGVRFGTEFGIRRHGPAYLAGFPPVDWILLRWSRRRRRGINEVEVPTSALCSALGAMIGSRLGYCLLYKARNICHLRLEIFPLGHGRMASHGRIALLIIVLWDIAPQPRMSMMPLLGAGAAALPGDN
jgi:phosphatidylglycerol:prolipoprotein diacylglycerol transferase